MERRHHRDRAHLMKLAAQPRNRRLDAEQRLRRELPEGHDDVRLHRRNLRAEERLTLLDLVRRLEACAS